MEITTRVLEEYGYAPGSYVVSPIGTGLINHTWKVKTHDRELILQEINTTVFRDPELIAKNISLIAAHLKEHAPDYEFVAPVLTRYGANMVVVEDRYFRAFPFVADSKTIDVVETPMQAYEAAQAFAKFSRLLSGFDASQLGETLKSFHNLADRYQQFIHALSYGNPERIKESAETIERISAHAHIVTKYLELRNDPGFKIRVTHNDTKISNVLFDQQDRANYVIDLDTVMPGYFISDVGDMMRTYLCPVSEEEKDFSRIMIRDDFFHAIVDGYTKEMNDELTAIERNHFLYAGQFMIYMQALRFLNDHLKDDVYYGAKYPGHNLVRAQNQLVLLEKLSEKKDLAPTG